MLIFDRILAARGLDRDSMAAFLNPDYNLLNNPMLLPDIDRAVDRLVLALEKQEKITIYGDYDIDGLTATTLMNDALRSLGFKNVEVFIPNRFSEGYGLNSEAIQRIADDGANLIITVDCGSRSHKEVDFANQLGVDVIITDHHETAEIQPAAIATVNPKRNDSKYPFKELAGVGVAFKLVQALQVKIKSGFDAGQEKWLLDLVALGTVCDVVPLVGENRIFAYFGLKVLSKTRRIGLKALMTVARVDLDQAINARTLGFVLGPRMNAAGRVETAQYSLDMLMAESNETALEKASQLDELNIIRRSEQSKIQKQAELLADIDNNPVLVLSNPDWNHGVVGIVAARLLEKYKKPTFILQEMGDITKGSARSFGDFSAADGVEFCRDILIKGGGHKLAAGISLETANIAKFRERINLFYKQVIKSDQSKLLLPQEDTAADFSELSEELVEQITSLEPFGNGNSQPVLRTNNVKVVNVRRMGSDGQHLKLELSDGVAMKVAFLAFNAPDYFSVEIGDIVDVWYHLDINEWQGRKSLEGKILHINKRK